MSAEFGRRFELQAQMSFVDMVTSCWIEAFTDGNYVYDHSSTDGNEYFRFERGNIDTFQRFTTKVEIDPTSHSLTPRSLVVTKLTFISDLEYEMEQMFAIEDMQKYRYRSGRFNLDLLNSSDRHINNIYRLHTNIEPARIIVLERFAQELQNSDPLPALHR